MATSYTHATLTASLESWMEDDGADFTGEIDNVIKLAEDRVLKDLGLSIFDANEALTGVAAATHAKPDGTILTRSLYLTIAGSVTFLKKRTKSYVQSYWPVAATTGTPAFYADDYSDALWLIAPTPGATYSGEAVVVKRPDSLVTDTTGTWISTNAGDLLFKAAMAESNIYAVADERVALMTKEYERALAMAKREFRHLMRVDYDAAAPG